MEPDLTTQVYPARYDPGDSTGDHLEFALKYEGINLEILRALFETAKGDVIAAYISSKPGGRYARKAWFLYEFLTGRRLDLPDLVMGNYVDLLDPDLYYTVPSVRSRRHRVNNNLPGDARYCPFIRRTAMLKKYESLALDKRCAELIKRYPEDMLQRALAYLYTKETKSSFEIEHVKPGQRRAMRFIALLRRAGKEDYFGKTALVTLQRAVVEDRFANNDYRDFQNYVGEAAGLSGEIVHFVAPKPCDLPALMEGWVRCCRQMMEAGVHPVVTAAVAAFGFVFLHPFEDGNGRLHRFLIHHVLSKTGFTPSGVIFPVSATMLKQRVKYDETLEFFSRPLMERMEYKLNARGEMTVLKDTVNFYRYMDMTRIVERLFEFAHDTVEKELAAELDFLVQYAGMKKALQEIVDLPDRKLDLFIRLCLQNKGRLAKGKRKEFSILTEDEITDMEEVIQRLGPDISRRA